MARCWWCGNHANSAEHKYKKSDLKTLFGAGRYNNERSLIIASKGKKDLKLKGPNSKFVKFSPSLCEDCNNNKSQPMDIAYSEFIAHIAKNFLSSPPDIIEIDNIWKKDQQDKIKCFFQYLTKNICCRLIDAHQNIPSEAIRFLNNEITYCPFEITFHYNVNYTAMNILAQQYTPIEGTSELHSYTENGTLTAIFSMIYFNWLAIKWTYYTDMKLITEPSSISYFSFPQITTTIHHSLM